MVASRRSAESGFTLVETMISVAIFAFGMLALAAFQLATLRVNIDTRGQTQTTLLAAEALGMIQADPQAPQTYNGVDTSNPASWPVSERAAGNVQRWTHDIQAALPRGRGSIQVDANTISIRIAVPGRAGDIGTSLTAPVP